MVCHSPQSVPSPVPLDSDEVSISSGLDRKSKPFSASSVSGSSLVSILAGDDDDDDDDEGFFLMIWEERLRAVLLLYNNNNFDFNADFRKYGNTGFLPSWIPH